MTIYREFRVICSFRDDRQVVRGSIQKHHIREYLWKNRTFDDTDYTVAFVKEWQDPVVVPEPGSEWIQKTGWNNLSCHRVRAHVFEVLENQVFFRYQSGNEWFHHKVGVPWFLDNYQLNG